MGSRLIWRMIAAQIALALVLALNLLAAQVSMGWGIAAGCLTALVMIGNAFGLARMIRVDGQQLAQSAEVKSAGATHTPRAIAHLDELQDVARAIDRLEDVHHKQLETYVQKAVRQDAHHAQLETVLESMVEGVIAVDAEDHILLANAAAIRILDLKVENIVGRRIWEVARALRLEELIQRALNADEQVRWEFDLPRTKVRVAVVATRFRSRGDFAAALPGNRVSENGLQSPLGPGSVSAAGNSKLGGVIGITPAADVVSPLGVTPGISAVGNRAGVVLVLHDVTELRRLENLRQEFVANVSHELKTPLSSISAYAETLLDGALEDQQRAHGFVSRISAQAERLQTLILDLLELASLEATERDDHPIELAEVDLTAIVRASLDAHQATANVKQISLALDVPGQPLVVYAEEAGVRTIIDNLLDNAINYTPSGGQVRVRCLADGDWVQFDVEDTGLGIAKEHQARIFERFYRVDRARSREIGGTGLGLAIVKHLCHLFAGTVQVSSQLGRGSIFTVRLPVRQDVIAG